MTPGDGASWLPVTDLIALQEIAPLRFRGANHAGSQGRMFGGQVAAQAVLAASLTVPAERLIHSAHMHFLRPGDMAAPAEFVVEETRDGGSFTSRRVQAVQHERVILTMTASFQSGEKGIEHSPPTPMTPPPEETPTPAEMFANDPENQKWAQLFADMMGVEVRFPAAPVRAAATHGQQVEARQSAWLRVDQPISNDPANEAAALAYVSDLLLLSTALGPHGIGYQDGHVQFATIDHSIWFHAPLRVDDWFLYEQESRWAGSSRALCHGEIYDRSGRLCATTMQEGLLRLR